MTDPARCPPGQVITPPLNCKMKFDHGFHHETTGSLLCPAGVNWDDPEWVLVICGMSLFTVFIFSRIKAKLRSGEMHVWGDQWPLFCMWTSNTIWRTPGLDCWGISCWFWYAGVLYLDYSVIRSAGIQTYLHLSKFCGFWWAQSN